MDHDWPQFQLITIIINNKHENLGIIVFKGYSLEDYFLKDVFQFDIQDKHLVGISPIQFWIAVVGKYNTT